MSRGACAPRAEHPGACVRRCTAHKHHAPRTTPVLEICWQRWQRAVCRKAVKGHLQAPRTQLLQQQARVRVAVALEHGVGGGRLLRQLAQPGGHAHAQDAVKQPQPLLDGVRGLCMVAAVADGHAAAAMALLQQRRSSRAFADGCALRCRMQHALQGTALHIHVTTSHTFANWSSSRNVPASPCTMLHRTCAAPPLLARAAPSPNLPGTCLQLLQPKYKDKQISESLMGPRQPLRLTIRTVKFSLLSQAACA